jgi:hypothetical protein
MIEQKGILISVLRYQTIVKEVAIMQITTSAYQK